MSLGENIQFLRKKENMTQEEFAEKMNVSRQTISKWESDAGFPETEKIVQICDLFSCSMDTLMRGNVEDTIVDDTEKYDHHQNRLTVAIAGACALILAGITIFLVLCGFGVSSVLSTMILLVFIVVSVTIFIISGIDNDNYVKKHPHIKPFYTDKEVEHFSRKYPLLIAVPTALILIGVIVVVGSNMITKPSNFSKDQWSMLASAVLLLFITISVPIYIYGGMQKSKYDINTYNKEHAQDEETLKRNGKVERWSSCIMLAATAIFLLMGFVWNLWDVSWVTFPIGGILCGIVSTMIGKK